MLNPAVGEDIVKLLPDSPTRPLDRRWKLADALRAGLLRRRRRLEDHWVRRAIRLQKAIDRAGGDLGDPRVARADPDLLAALWLHHGDEMTRWEVEARLLAGQDPGVIAGLCGIPAGVVVAYEAAFYDVRDALEAKDWLLFTAIGPRLYDGAAFGVEVAWKVLAINGGPHVLDAAIARVGDLLNAPDPEEDPRRLDPLGLLFAVCRLAVTGEDAEKFLRFEARLRDLERRIGPQGADTGAPTGISPPIDAAIGARTDPNVHANCAPDARGPAAGTSSGGGEGDLMRGVDPPLGLTG